MARYYKDRIKNGNLADDALKSIVVLNEEVGLLDNGRIVIRRDHWELSSKVKILGGGCSGHDPAFAGYVGNGFLTAAVKGDIFETPSANIILTAIRELGTDHYPGVLVIIQNTTQERLAFSHATEKAQQFSINCKLIVISDDCFTEARCGLSGIILIMKIASAMAEEGQSLDVIYNYCMKIKNYLASCSVRIEPCIGTGLQFCELGVSLKGIGRFKKMEVATATEVVKLITDHITKVNMLSFAETTTNQLPIFVLVNTLGGTSVIEDQIITSEIIIQLQKLQYRITKLFFGSYISSLKVRGYTITILLDCDVDLIKYLEAPTSAFAWNRIPKINSQSLTIPSIVPKIPAPIYYGPKISFRTAQFLPSIMTFSFNALISSERQLNTMDLESEDTGSNAAKMAQRFKALLTCVERQPGRILWLLSTNCCTQGALAALYTIGFEAAAKVFMNKAEDFQVNGIIWLEVLETAINDIKRIGNVETGDNTMVDSLESALINMQQIPQAQLINDPLAVAKAAAEAAETAASLTARFRRNRFIEGSRMSTQKIPDPGAHVVGIWMRALYEGFKAKYPSNE